MLLRIHNKKWKFLFYKNNIVSPAPTGLEPSLLYNCSLMEVKRFNHFATQADLIVNSVQ